MNQEGIARLLYEHFVEWANRLNQGEVGAKARKRWATFDQPWERLSEDRRQVFVNLADEILSPTSQDEFKLEPVPALEPVPESIVTRPRKKRAAH